MSDINVTLDEFIAMPGYRRDLYRQYSTIEYPPDNELPPPPEVVELWGKIVSRSVYFIREGEDGPIKIGVATDCDKRLSQLQVGNSSELNIIFKVQGGTILESELHEKFRAHRMRGEWFAPHPDIFAEIERLRNWEPPKLRSIRPNTPIPQ